VHTEASARRNAGTVQGTAVGTSAAAGIPEGFLSVKPGGAAQGGAVETSPATP